MGKFDKGVSFYTSGECSIKVHFPEDDICCQWCKFCRAENDLNRYWCRLTNDIIYNPYMGIADTCPLKFGEIKEE